MPIGEVLSRFEAESNEMGSFECERVSGLTIMHCDGDDEEDESSETFVSFMWRILIDAWFGVSVCELHRDESLTFSSLYDNYSEIGTRDRAQSHL